MKRFGIIIVAAMMAAGLAGCESLPGPNTKPDPVVADVLGTSHEAADTLIARAGANLDPGKPLIAATFVNIDDLNRASSFGRIVSEQVATKFTVRGYQVKEMLLRNNVYIKQRGGEFLLSREIQNISSEHNAQAVLVGTYAVARKNVYVTARLIRAGDSVIIASYDYTLPLDRDVAFMLKNG
jgi:TolB-like protein